MIGAVSDPTPALRMVRAKLLRSFMRLDEASDELERIPARDRGEAWFRLKVDVLRHGDTSQREQALELAGRALANTVQQDAWQLSRAGLLISLGDEAAGLGECWSMLRGEQPELGAIALLLSTRLTSGEARDLLMRYGDQLRCQNAPAGAFAQYLALLTRCGESDSAAHEAGLPRLVQRRQLFAPDDPINAAVADEIRGSPDLFHAGMRLPGRNLLRLEGLPKPGMVAMPRLLRALADAVKQYAESLAEDDQHRFVAARPTAARLHAWAASATPNGYEAWHTHNQSWLSGTYYAAMPVSATGGDGALQFGWPGGDNAQQALTGHVQLSLQPLAGEVIFFPAYQHHRTTMLGHPGPRIAIAFDIVPVASAQ